MSQARKYSLSRTTKAEQQGSASERCQKSSLGNQKMSGPGLNRKGRPKPQVIRIMAHKVIYYNNRKRMTRTAKNLDPISLLPKSKHEFRQQTVDHTPNFLHDRTQEKGQEKTRLQTRSSHGGDPFSNRQGTNKRQMWRTDLTSLKYSCFVLDDRTRVPTGATTPPVSL